MSHSDIHLSVSLPYSPAAFLSHRLPFLDMGHFLCRSFLHAIIGMTSGRRKTLHVPVAFSRVWAKQMSGRALRCWCHAAWATDFISDASQPSGGKWVCALTSLCFSFLWSCDDSSAPVSGLCPIILSLQFWCAYSSRAHLHLHQPLFRRPRDTPSPRQSLSSAGQHPHGLTPFASCGRHPQLPCLLPQPSAAPARLMPRTWLGPDHLHSRCLNLSRELRKEMTHYRHCPAQPSSDNVNFPCHSPQLFQDFPSKKTVFKILGSTTDEGCWPAGVTGMNAVVAEIVQHDHFHWQMAIARVVKTPIPPQYPLPPKHTQATLAPPQLKG